VPRELPPSRRDLGSGYERVQVDSGDPHVLADLVEADTPLVDQSADESHGSAQLRGGIFHGQQSRHVALQVAVVRWIFGRGRTRNVTTPGGH